MNLKLPFTRKLSLRIMDLYRFYKRIKYTRFPKGHAFHIAIDDFKYKLTFGDHPISYPIVQRIEGRREPETMAIYRSLIRPGSRIVELGSCYGEFTILMAHHAGPTGKVVAIEGTPSIFKILQENLRINNVRNVDAYNRFVSIAGGHVRYNASDIHPYNAINSTNDTHEVKTNYFENEILVSTVRLSAFLSYLDFTPDLFFMDIEGFEVDVFEDFFQCGYLEMHRPTILFEIHPRFYEPGKDHNYIETELVKYDYVCRAIAGNILCFPANA